MNTSMKTSAGQKFGLQAPRSRTGPLANPLQQPQGRPSVAVNATPVPLKNKKEGKASFYSIITGFPFPLEPSLSRKTIRYEVIPDRMWTFEQEQGIGLGLNVSTNVRMTVIKLEDGGLWVHAPVAPTDDCLKLLKELDAPVEHIVLPTFAYEHKVFVGPFSSKFPKAKVYLAPGQWSFPLNLPDAFFGIFNAITLRDDEEYEWSGEIDHKIFRPPPLGVAKFVSLTEVAFFHKPTKTLLVTDAVVYVPESPPDIVPRPMVLEQAKNNVFFKLVSPKPEEEVEEIDPREDLEGAIRRGWSRMALQSLYFGPSDLLQPEESFDAIRSKLTVSPVLKTLVYRQARLTTQRWVDSICRDWAFTSIIPCHFTAPIKSSPQEFRDAFAFVFADKETGEIPPMETVKPAPSGGLFGAFKLPFIGGAPKAPAKKILVEPPVVKKDLKTLDSLWNILLSIKAVDPNPEKNMQ